MSGSFIGKNPKIPAIEQVAAAKTTSGIWYTWGTKEHLEQWINAASIKAHTQHLITEGKIPHQGPGLYLASSPFRSAQWCPKANGRMLVVILNNVPTIDVSDAGQKGQLQIALGTDPGKSFDALYPKELLAEMFFIYTTSGDYGRLTTSTGVTLTLDLKSADLAALAADVKKMSVNAKDAIRTQAQESGVDVSTWQFV